MILVLLNNFTDSFKQYFKSRFNPRQETTSKQVNLKEEEFDFKAANFLVVDDDDLCKFVFARYLEKWNGKVDIAKTGKEAVELIKGKKYDAVLMDIEMPEMDGFEATSTIRQLEGSYFKQVPILAVTSLNVQGMKAKLDSVGVNDCIPKEVSQLDLYRKLSSFVSKTRQ